MLTIGLTGGVGSGKSTVTQLFASLGVPVIDADELARQLVEKGQAAYYQIIDKFGQQILAEDGEINRRKLRELIFTSANNRIALESILHPLIRREIQQHIQQIDAPYCIVAIPLLIETGQANIVERILVVNAPKEAQINRTVNRDAVTPAEVEAIVAAQVGNDLRLSIADDVLQNDGELADIFPKVKALHAKYLSLAGVEVPIEPGESVKDVAESAITEQKPKVAISAPPPEITLPESKQSMQSSSVQLLADKNHNIYELPLNEKMRTFIRLEFLFSEVEHFLAGSTIWDLRSAVNALIATLSVVCRPEIKTDLMKELDRINANLAKFDSKSGVNSGVLSDLRDDLTSKSRSLRNMEGQLGQGLKQNELVSALRQRESIPGGALAMDMPSYAHWLNQSYAQCVADIQTWLASFTLVKEAVDLILSLIRGSVVAHDVVAKAGFYQLTLDPDVANQIVRVILPKNADCFPEISGGRHRFTVRFLRPNGFERPVQVEDDVTFKLICCAL